MVTIESVIAQLFYVASGVAARSVSLKRCWLPHSRVPPPIARAPATGDRRPAIGGGELLRRRQPPPVGRYAAAPTDL